MMDRFDSEQGKVEQIKGLLATGGDFERVKALFPDYFAAEDPYEQAIDPETGEFDINRIDDSQLEWGVPTPEEDEAMAQWIAERQSGTITVADLDQNEWI